MQVVINSSTGYSSSNNAFDINFVGQTTINVTHNLSAKPIVSVSNTMGQQIFGQVTYPTLNNFTIDFNSPQSGSIRYI